MMITNQQASCNRQGDRGVSILIIAVSMIFILGFAGLSIDLASLYVGRSQAQRAADAGALAGAQYLATQGCTSDGGGTISSACQVIARQHAIAVGNQNLVAGVSPAIGEDDVTFLSTSISDPQIQVIASRDSTHNNPMPTFFVKIFGVNTANVSAKADAEAYNSAGQSTPVGARCLKPWLLPNCDPNSSHTASPNPYCGGASKFVDGGNIVYPGNISQGGVLGELIQIKSSNPTQASAPSQFYPVFLPENSATPSACPSCALNPSGGGPASGALYRSNISCCNQTQIVCGSNTIQPITGDMVGPTGLGVDCLIHQKGGSGQDILDPQSFVITAGSRNPYGSSGPISNSDSIVTVPLYDGFTLCPGNSCPSQVAVQVIGFLQMFIENEINGNVNAYVMNVVPCPAGSGSPTGAGGAGGVIAAGGSPVVVRLIHE